MYSTNKKLKMPGKKASHRNAITRSLVMDLLRAERVKTTPTKAKIMKTQIDKLITAAKKDTGASKRTIQSFFASNEFAIEKLYKVANRITDRNSGYTRIIHTLPRKGDNSKQVYIMFVDFEAKEKKTKLQSLLEKKETKASKKVSKKAQKAERVKSEKVKEAVVSKSTNTKTRRISM